MYWAKICNEDENFISKLYFGGIYLGKLTKADNSYMFVLSEKDGIASSVWYINDAGNAAQAKAQVEEYLYQYYDFVEKQAVLMKSVLDRYTFH